MTPEGRVKAKVKKALDTLGTDVWRFMPVQTGFGSPALDYLLCIKGRFVAIETKAPGKKLPPLQEGTKAAMEAAGGIVLVVWDETSLEIAMKIILALEFTPDVADRNETIRACLDVDRKAKTEGQGDQYVCERFAPEETDAAAGGDHGAPGAAPKRPAKQAAGR